MSRQEPAKPVLANLLEWERPSKRQTDPFEGEYIIPGPVDGFVDQAAKYVTALRSAGEVDDVLNRAKQFESLTAHESALDAARIAIRPIVEAIAKAREGIGGVEWGESRPPRLTADGFMVRRRPPPGDLPRRGKCNREPWHFDRFCSVESRRIASLCA